MMKNILFLVLFVAPAVIGTAQNFDEVGNLKHVSETRVTGAMFKMIASFDSDDPEFEELMKTVGNLKDLRIYTTSDKTSALKMKSIANSFINKNKMELLMSVKEDGQNFALHMLKGNTESKIRELLMFIDDTDNNKDESVLMVLSGDLDMKQISKITKSLDIPGQKQIEKATQE